MPQAERASYTITTRENGALVSADEIVDPFVHHRVVPRGWRNALLVLRGRYELTVEIAADRELVERVLELNSDYLGPAGSPSREAWTAQLNNALRRFAENL